MEEPVHSIEPHRAQRVVVFSMMLFVRALPRGQGAKKEEAVLT